MPSKCLEKSMLEPANLVKTRQHLSQQASSALLDQMDSVLRNVVYVSDRSDLKDVFWHIEKHRAMRQSDHAHIGRGGEFKLHRLGKLEMSLGALTLSRRSYGASAPI